MDVDWIIKYPIHATPIINSQALWYTLWNVYIYESLIHLNFDIHYYPEISNNSIVELFRK